MKNNVIEIVGTKVTEKPVLDRNMRKLIEAMNRIPGIATYSSCGGHKKSNRAIGRLGYLCYEVRFWVEVSRTGREALGLLTMAIVDHLRRPFPMMDSLPCMKPCLGELAPHDVVMENGKMAFSLRGHVCQDSLAESIEDILDGPE